MENSVKQTKNPIDKVTPEHLDVLLRFLGVQVHEEILKVILPAVKHLEEHGGDTTLSEMVKLKDELGR